MTFHYEFNQCKDYRDLKAGWDKLAAELSSPSVYNSWLVVVGVTHLGGRPSSTFIRTPNCVIYILATTLGPSDCTVMIDFGFAVIVDDGKYTDNFSQPTDNTWNEIRPSRGAFRNNFGLRKGIFQGRNIGQWCSDTDMFELNTQNLFLKWKLCVCRADKKNKVHCWLGGLWYSRWRSYLRRWWCVHWPTEWMWGWHSFIHSSNERQFW